MSLRIPNNNEPSHEEVKENENLTDEDLQRDIEELIEEYGDQMIEEILNAELPPGFEEQFKKDQETMDPIDLVKKYDPDLVTEDGYIIIE